MAIVRNITEDDGWFVGETKVLEDTVYQESATDEEIAAYEAGEGPAPAKEDITGWRIRFAAGTIVSKDSNVAGQITIVDGPNGLLRVSIASADTEAAVPGVYPYSIVRDDTQFWVLTTGTAVLQRSVLHTPSP